MIVTGIEEMSRSRVRIYLDESFAFVLYKGELRLYGIKEGSELGEDVYEQLIEEVLTKRATLRSMNLLKSRPYTETQLRDKLIQGEYPLKCINAALAYVKSFHYVDDDRYAQDYIENQQGKKSRRMIEMDLIRKGISSDQIQNAFAAQEEMGNTPDEEALARQWMKKKHFDPERADYPERRKMYAFLYRKGISGSTLRRIFSEMADEY
ncbi:MAG: regulatory protein RecX [Lachnospiraceae bacterium]|nr:regulatory protein RecX [Lachnospiraceae bacterium]